MEITLTTLKKGITSLIIIPPDIENMFEKIYEAKVPDQWLKSNIINIYVITHIFFIFNISADLISHLYIFF